ncbi:MAG TPA: YihY/virulence factor BrkB family protein [Candidatus Sulfotelmatobacter sp.]|nr:YihY/virulence factor BrkB family protein [Candidatus Sulfotelmatobacter sp.]
MIASAALAKRAYGVFGRVFPRTSMLAQAVAYNLFLAFFPALLILVGVATSPIGRRTSMFDLIRDMTDLMPPGSQQIVSEFLVNRGPDAWKLALVGLVGTLLAGTQVMRLLMEGIQTIYADHDRPGYLQRQLRSVALLLITITPLMGAALLGVFGRPLRRWVAYELGRNQSIETLWGVFFHGTAIFLAMVALTIIYRVARPRESSLRSVLPGALVATAMWWIADIIFGFYVRRVPYNVVYGGLAAVIGLLIWMQISTVIIFAGAAWNAESAEMRRRQVHEHVV